LLADLPLLEHISLEGSDTESDDSSGAEAKKTPLQEFAEVKEKVFLDYEKDLKEKRKKIIKLENVISNFQKLLTKFSQVVGYSFYESVKRGDFPAGFNFEEKNPRLTTLIFRNYKKNVLRKRTVGQILHKGKRQNQLLNQILGTTDLPRD